MRRCTQAHGFSLVSAIFILDIVSLVAAGMLSLVAGERRSSTFGLLGTRAYQAGRSGIEWGVAKIAADPTVCAAGVFGLGEGGLRGFSVTVTCSLTVHEENTVTANVFRLTSLAEFGSFGDADYVSRRIEATVTEEL